jgi:hypothetical protein
VRHGHLGASSFVGAVNFHFFCSGGNVEVKFQNVMKVDAFHHKKNVWFDWLKRLLFHDEQLF